MSLDFKCELEEYFVITFVEEGFVRKTRKHEIGNLEIHLIRHR